MSRIKIGHQPGALTEGAEITGLEGDCQWGKVKIWGDFIQILPRSYPNRKNTFKKLWIAPFLATKYPFPWIWGALL